MYLIRRERDGRPIAGIFYPIKTEAEALAVLARWQHNCPGESFVVVQA